MIYVTHDQTEALTFADKVVVMYDGRVVQIGTPQELFETPAHTFVGYFIGSPGMNVLAARGRGRPARMSAASRSRSAPPTASRRAGSQIGVRPEFVQPDRGARACRSTIRRVEDVGRHQIVRAEFFGQRHQRDRCREGAAMPADMTRVSFDPARSQRLRRRLARRPERHGEAA